MEKLVLKVEGMTCGGCVNSVERALERVPGVTRARADLKSGTAVVEGSGLEIERLAAALEDAGYEGRPA